MGSARYEQQADCLAGAALAMAERDGLVILDSGDFGEMANTVSDLGDHAGSHGTPAEREPRAPVLALPWASREQGYRAWALAVAPPSWSPAAVPG